MKLQKELLLRFNDDDFEKAFEILSKIDSTKLSNKIRTVQSALITLSNGNLTSLKDYVKLIYKKENDILEASQVIENDSQNLNDIKIGNNEYIKWIPLGRDFESRNIDEKLCLTKDFWDYLATECVYECCGLSACNFESDNVLNAIEKLKDNDLLYKWNKLQQEIGLIDDEIIGSSYLNQNINKKIFLKLLEYIEDKITVHNNL